MADVHYLRPIAVVNPAADLHLVFATFIIHAESSAAVAANIPNVGVAYN